MCTGVWELGEDVEHVTCNPKKNRISLMLKSRPREALVLQARSLKDAKRWHKAIKDQLEAMGSCGGDVESSCSCASISRSRPCDVPPAASKLVRTFSSWVATRSMRQRVMSWGSFGGVRKFEARGNHVKMPIRYTSAAKKRYATGVRPADDASLA